MMPDLFDDDDCIACDSLDSVNSDPDAEERDPEDDTIGHPCDEMAQWEA